MQSGILAQSRGILLFDRTVTHFYSNRGIRRADSTVRSGGPVLPPTSVPLYPAVYSGAMSRGARCYVATVFADGSEEPLRLLDPSTWPHVTFFVYQRELCPRTAREHFQCYMELDGAVRFSSLQSSCEGLETAHFESRKGTQIQAIAYAVKPDVYKGCTLFIDDATRIEGPWWFGEPKHQGQRADLITIQREIREGVSNKRIADEFFPEWVRFGKSFKEYKRLSTRQRDFKTITILICGPSGLGKSRFGHLLSRYLAQEGRCDELKFPELRYDKDINPVVRGISLSDDSSMPYVLPEKHTGFWADDYDSESVFFIDEFGGHRCTPTFFNGLADRYPFVVPVHGSAGHQMVARYLVICTNYAPKYWWKNRNADQLRQTTRRIDVLIKMIPTRAARPTVVYDPVTQQFIHKPAFG